MGLLDKALEQSQIDNLDSSDVKDVGEACNELDDVRKKLKLSSLKTESTN
jgi:hypothetical protein